uniref:HTH_48 domain-containing protein n=1 Tax=Strongyloides stercoralis TaxID=6248 RepID=A0A0K0EG06_STRER
MSKLDLRTIFFVFGEGSISRRTIERWFKKFRNGDTSLEDKEGRGRNSVLENKELKSLVEQNPCTTVKELAQELNVSTGTIFNNLKASNKTKKMDTWVPHELTNEQCLRRMEYSSSLLLRHKNEPFLKRIITCDEKWILYDIRKRSSQWLDRSEPPKTFSKPKLYQKKIMLTVWWNFEGLIYHHFLNPGETITAEVYCEELEEMHGKLMKLKPALINRKGPILLHDNARPHISQTTVKKLIALGYETLPHFPYLPDLSLTDYHIFKHMDAFMKGKKFSNLEDLKSNVMEFLLLKDLVFYENRMEKLLTRWQQCVKSNGFYFK